MYKCRNYFDKETMGNLYFSFIYPYLTYCVEIWGNACNIHLDPIVKLKKKCIRTITYSSYLEHTQPLFDSLNILCFHKLVIQRISLIMFKNEVGLVPKLISQLFTRNSEYHDYNTIDTVVLFISQLGEVKRSTDLLAFMELTFGIFKKYMHPLMCHIYV